MQSGEIRTDKINNPRFQSIVDIIGSYFTDIYFNSIHKTATKNVTAESSVTDEYRNSTDRFIQGVKTDERHYRSVITSLHRYFSEETKFSSISFVSFVDIIIEQFVPIEYYQLLVTQDKDEMLSSIVCDLVSNLGVFVTTHSSLKRIIDEHDTGAAVTINMIKEHAKQTMTAKKDNIRNEFLKRKGQCQEMIPASVAESLRAEITMLDKQRSVDKDEIEFLNREVVKLNSILQTQREKETKYRKFIGVMHEQRNNLIANFQNKSVEEFATPVLDQMITAELAPRYVDTATSIEKRPEVIKLKQPEQTASSERSASDRTASDRTASERTASNRTASEQIVPERPVSKQTAPERPVSFVTDIDQTLSILKNSITDSAIGIDSDEEDEGGQITLYDRVSR